MPRVKVRLLFFAVLRDITGQDEAELEVEAGTRPLDIWQRLRAEHGRLRDYEQPPMTAVNESYEPPDVELRDGDELAFIPPVAGG